MQPTGKWQLAFKKAYEISYALFRIAAKIGNAAFKDQLERQALSLLDAATNRNVGEAESKGAAIEYLVKFGSDVGLIHESNAETIVMQVHALNAAIAGLDKPAMPEAVSLENIFSRESPLFVEPKRSVPIVEEPAIVKSGNRQSAIIDRIRQSGNCRMKDIQEILPETSERTIRYDLQSLIEQNVIERVGTGGPAVFYRMRQTVQSLPIAEGSQIG